MLSYTFQMRLVDKARQRYGVAWIFEIDSFLAMDFTAIMRKICLLLIVLSFTACDLFRLRESETPENPALWNEPCIEWQQCFENLDNAYANFQNWDRYEGQFTEDFRFYFAPQDINDYSISTVWDRSRERDVLYNLHNWYTKLELEFYNSSTADDIGANLARIYRAYRLTAIRKGSTESYYGNLELQLVKQNGIWKIKAWYDYRSGAENTWGKLKYDRR